MFRKLHTVYLFRLAEFTEMFYIIAMCLKCASLALFISSKAMYVSGVLAKIAAAGGNLR